MPGALVFLSVVLMGCAGGAGPSSPDEGSESIRFLPDEPQTLVVGERRSLWATATGRAGEVELSVDTGGALRELGRERLFGGGTVRLDVEGLQSGTALVHARVSGVQTQTTLLVAAGGVPRCETDGPPPYCVTGRYRIKASELGHQCTGEGDSFETSGEITRTTVHGDSATLDLGDDTALRGMIAPDGVFFSELPQPIGSFRDGRQVIVEQAVIKVAGFTVQGTIDVIGLFPSPDPIEEAVCERTWVLEGERL